MTKAAELVDAVTKELRPRDADNALVPLVTAGTAARTVFGALAAEELRIVPSDWRSFLTLAARAEQPATRAFFAGLAEGERHALDLLPALVAGTGTATGRRQLPRPGCQAYPAYLAWLALNARPGEVVVAVAANFAAWGRYCAALSAGMRGHYGFDEAACAFFDLFAVPSPAEPALEAIAAGLDAHELDVTAAREYAHLFQSYELMFWNTLADEAG